MSARLHSFFRPLLQLGLMLRHSSDATLNVLNDLSDAVSGIVRLVIRFAPLGIFGLVANTLADAGVSALLDYGRLLGVIVGCMLLIPLATSLFGISTEVAMQVVAIGFVISVVQDSTETALNSSTDILFTAAACRSAEARQG